MKKRGQDIRHTGQISKQEPIKQVTNLTTLFSVLGTNVWSFLDIIDSYFRVCSTEQTETWPGLVVVQAVCHRLLTIGGSVRSQTTAGGSFGARSRKMTDPSPSTSVFSIVSSIQPCSSLTHLSPKLHNARN
jgi:hypothetical protein